MSPLPITILEIKEECGGMACLCNRIWQQDIVRKGRAEILPHCTPLLSQTELSTDQEKMGSSPSKRRFSECGEK